MTMIPDDPLEDRLLAPSDLGEFIKTLRDMNKWTQATLAEIARVTERTIQRVENGESSSLDTRRALARAFGYEDLDVFDKPWPLPNVEKLRTYAAQLEKTTAVIPITRIGDARTLRTMTEGAESSATEEIGELAPEAREAFASIVDYLRDYNDVRDLYSMSQRLDVDRDIDALLKAIRDGSAAVGAGLRHARVRFKSDGANCEPMDWTNIYFVLAPSGSLPLNVRVPKAFKFA
ncbi:MAG: helix-turn-helix transcriptional regulator [Acidobacteriota bacterium]